MDLGYSTSETPLATTTTCPKCDNSVELFDDLDTKSLWFSCKCGFFGNIIDFAAEVWKISTEDSAAKLRLGGRYADDDTTDWRVWYERNLKFRYAWQSYLTSKKALDSVFYSDTGLRPILLDFQLSTDPSKYEVAGTAPLLAGVDATSGLVSRGCWICLPAYVIPGAPASLLLMAKTPLGSVTRTVRISPTDGGLYGVQVVHSAKCTNKYGSTVVIFDDDPLLLLRLQSSSMDMTNSFLPLCSTTSSGVTTSCLGRALYKNDIIRYVRKIDWGLLKSAALTDARIALISDVGLDEKNAASRTADMWMRSLLSSARSWEHLLMKEAEKISDEDLTRELRRLGSEVPVLESKLSGLPDSETKRRIMRIFETELGGSKTIIVGGTRYTSNKSGWFANGKLLTDVRIELDEIVKEGDAAAEYSGTLSRGDKKITFKTPAFKFEKGLCSWIFNFASINGLDSPALATKDSQLLYKLSRWFSSPKIIDKNLGFGWSKTTNGFVVGGVPAAKMEIRGRGLSSEEYLLSSYLVLAALCSLSKYRVPDMVITATDHRRTVKIVDLMESIGLPTFFEKSRRRDFSTGSVLFLKDYDREAHGDLLSSKDRPSIVAFGDDRLHLMLSTLRPTVHLRLMADSVIRVGHLKDVLSTFLAGRIISDNVKTTKEAKTLLAAGYDGWVMDYLGVTKKYRSILKAQDKEKALSRLLRWLVREDLLELSTEPTKLTEIVRTGTDSWFLPEKAVDLALSFAGLPRLGARRLERRLELTAHRTKNRLKNKRVLSGWTLDRAKFKRFFLTTT